MLLTYEPVCCMACITRIYNLIKIKHFFDLLDLCIKNLRACAWFKFQYNIQLWTLILLISPLFKFILNNNSTLTNVCCQESRFDFGWFQISRLEQTRKGVLLMVRWFYCSRDVDMSDWRYFYCRRAHFGKVKELADLSGGA